MLYLLRIIRFGAQNFWRNIWLSVVTVFIVTLSLFLMTSVYGLILLGDQTLTAVKEKVSLSVYFKPTTTDDRAAAVRSDLIQRDDVKTITVVTRQQHLEQFKEEQKNNAVALEGLKQLGENPFGPGLVIVAKDFADFPAIAKAVEDPQYTALVEETGKDYETNKLLITKISRYLKPVQTATIWLTLVFAAITILMVFNTIRVAIYSQREEIGIMKLVGASDAFVRGPFVVASLMYGLIAALITSAIVLPIVVVGRPGFDAFFSGYTVDVAGFVISHFWALLGLEAVAGMVLSAVSSLGAIGRYLRV